MSDTDAKFIERLTKAVGPQKAQKLADEMNAEDNEAFRKKARALITAAREGVDKSIVDDIRAKIVDLSETYNKMVVRSSYANACDDPAVSGIARALATAQALADTLPTYDPENLDA